MSYPQTESAGPFATQSFGDEHHHLRKDGNLPDDTLGQFYGVWYRGMQDAAATAKRREEKRRHKFERRDNPPWYKRHAHP